MISIHSAEAIESEEKVRKPSHVETRPDLLRGEFSRRTLGRMESDENDGQEDQEDQEDDGHDDEHKAPESQQVSNQFLSYSNSNPELGSQKNLSTMVCDVLLSL